MELAGLELRYVVQELQSLCGAKVEKIFQSERKRDLLFLLYLKDSPKVHLRFVLPGILFATNVKPDYPTLPPGFAMFLRKYLSGVRLEGVKQLGMDRIIEFTFASKTATFALVVELMPPGNMLLLDGERRIINLLENQQTKDRSLRGRQVYVAPPASFDCAAISEEELARHISMSTKDSLVTTLAINCSLGGIYAEEVCVRAKVAKHRNDLTPEEVARVTHAVKELLELPLQAHSDKDRAYPFAMHSRPVTPCEESSYLHSLASFITEEKQDKHEENMRVRQAPKNKLQTMIDAQTKQIKKFEEDTAAEQRKAERLYEEYLLVQEILQVAHDARVKKENIEVALKQFKEVKSYKPATGEIEIELEDA